MAELKHQYEPRFSLAKQIDLTSEVPRATQKDHEFWSYILVWLLPHSENKIPLLS